MKSYTKPVYVPKKEIERLNRLLDVVYDEEDMEKEEVEPDSTLFIRTARFDDGYEVDVKVCSGQANLWSEAVLFDPDGNEVYCTDPTYDNIDGEWSLESDDTVYNVIVKEKEDGQ